MTKTEMEKRLRVIKKSHSAPSQVWDGHPLTKKWHDFLLSECELFEAWLKYNSENKELRKVCFVYYAYSKLDLDEFELNTQWLYKLVKKFPFLTRWFGGYGYGLFVVYDDGTMTVHIALGDTVTSLDDALFFMAHEFRHAQQHLGMTNKMKAWADEKDANKWAEEIVDRYFKEVYDYE